MISAAKPGVINTTSRISVVVAAALFIAACSGSATIDETAASATVEPTVAQAEPTAVPAESTAAQTDPTAVPAEPTTIVAPTAVGATMLVEDFRADSLLGLSNGGDFAYAGTSSPYYSPSACADSPTESIAVVAVKVAANGTLSPVGAGLEQIGHVRQVIFDGAGQVAVLSTCGEPNDDEAFWMHVASVADDGTFNDIVGPFPLAADANQSGPWLSRWVDGDTIELRVTVEVDPDNFEEWIIERQHISASSGAISTVEQFGYYDDDARFAPVELKTDQGFTYRQIEDPDRAVGCEGFGVARTIEVDDGTEQRLALGADGPVFSNVGDLHIASTGHIAWTSGCEGFTSVYVGKVQADGSIADAHLVEVEPTQDQSFADFRYYQLSDDGALVSVGVSFGDTGESGDIVFRRFDLSADPSFVNTADPALAIDEDPILVAVDGVSSWHVGETLGAVRACGGKTLYGRTQTGFVRAFGQYNEIDAIVDADATQIVRVSFDDGDYASRTVVFSTICPGEYEGRRLWFGIENDTVTWGIALQQADMDAVKDVLSVRDQFREGQEFPDASFVEVELFDGTITEIELSAVPFEG